jgi:hypothetical protein
VELPARHERRQVGFAPVNLGLACPWRIVISGNHRARNIVTS